MQDKDPEPSGIEGLNDVRIIRALYQSIEAGKPVQIKGLERRHPRPTAAQTIQRPPNQEKPDLIQLLDQSTSSVPAQSAPEEIAAEVTPEAKIADLTQPNPTRQQVAGKPAFGGTSQPSQNTPAKDAIAQVTSVSQLSDVQPTDWAFQALQSLVERYGCIVGYADGTYRGNRALRAMNLPPV